MMCTNTIILDIFLTNIITYKIFKPLGGSSKSWNRKKRKRFFSFKIFKYQRKLRKLSIKSILNKANKSPRQFLNQFFLTSSGYHIANNNLLNPTANSIGSVLPGKNLILCQTGREILQNKNVDLNRPLFVCAFNLIFATIFHVKRAFIGIRILYVTINTLLSQPGHPSKWSKTVYTGVLKKNVSQLENGVKGWVVRIELKWYNCIFSTQILQTWRV